MTTMVHKHLTTIAILAYAQSGICESSIVAAATGSIGNANEIFDEVLGLGDSIEASEQGFEHSEVEAGEVKAGSVSMKKLLRGEVMMNTHGVSDSIIEIDEEEVQDVAVGVVDYLYTIGAPSIALNPAVSNPGNTCIPGIRIYSEDYDSCVGHTGVDFASQILAHYPHPKMSTLVLRKTRTHGWFSSWDDYQHGWYECSDSDEVEIYDSQYYPDYWDPPSISLHDIELYGERLNEFQNENTDKFSDNEAPSSVRTIDSPWLKYLSVTWCTGHDDVQATNDCHKEQWVTDTFQGGVDSMGYSAIAHMVVDNTADDREDIDMVYVMKKDSDVGRECIISFQESGDDEDYLAFIHGQFSEGSTDYCGRSGVHIGVSRELSKIARHDGYQNSIKPALETCSQVTCIGFSLGGALCDLFTMCVNNPPGEDSDVRGRDDYQRLKWERQV